MNLVSNGDEKTETSVSALRRLADERAPILQQLSEGVIIADTDGRLVFVNEAAELLHGVKKLDIAPDEYSASYSLFTMQGEPYPFDELPLARAVARGETVADARWRIRRPDGSEVIAIGTARPLTSGDRQIGAILNVRDDSDRFESERKLRESEERLRLVIDAASDYAIFTTDPERIVTSWSKGAELAFGYAPNEIIGQCADILWMPDDQARGQPATEIETARRAGCANNERWHRRKDGSQVFMNGSVHPLPCNEDGSERGFIKIAQDETERHATAYALMESEERTRLVLDNTASAFYSVDRTGHTTLVSRPFLDMMGFSEESDVLGRKLHDIIHHTHPDGTHYPVEECPIYGCASTAEPAHVPEELFFRLDGTPVPVEYWVAPIMRGDEHLGATCTILDLTDRKAAEQALRERSEEFYTLADNIPSLAWMAYADGGIFWYNRRWYEYTGTSPETQAGWGWESVHHPDTLPAVVERWTASIESGTPFEMTFPLKGADGEFRPFLTRVVPIRDDDGAILRWFGTNVDVTAQVEAETQLQQLNATLEARVEQRTAERDRVWNVSQDLFVICGFDGQYREANPAWTKQLGYPRDSLIGTHFDELVHPDDVASTQAKFERLISGAVIENFDIRIRARDGAYRWYSWTCVPEADSFYAAGRDVTQRKELEEQLRQSQKMETVGQLTGGIAHDFNNLLQVIIGNLDILSRGLREDSPRLRRSIDNAAKGAERAAVLTQRLLAFSRRQPLAPKVIDPNKLVSGMSDMLHRTLGETYSIETVTGSGLWRVEADPHQLESALLNLAINARDAMPEGGKLTVETSNAHIDRVYSDRHGGVLPGQYAVICVSDTGCGMDQATVEKAFEPFFTTKDVGKGTGLGLSMVYGFVKQSGGHLKIYSEPGEGTTVKIYLPRHHGQESDAAAGGSTDAPEGADGETILVCEDDDDVRAFSAEVLRELGYRVIEAADGESALRLLAADEAHIDLLFTDIVLPGGMTGAVVGERARAMHPALKVLFTTGYARNAIVHHGRLDPGVELLSKPFSYADLAARVRDLLDKG